MSPCFCDDLARSTYLVGQDNDRFLDCAPSHVLVLGQEIGGRNLSIARNTEYCARRQRRLEYVKVRIVLLAL